LNSFLKKQCDNCSRNYQNLHSLIMPKRSTVQYRNALSDLFRGDKLSLRLAVKKE
jgi:hypothetical protein